MYKKMRIKRSILSISVALILTFTITACKKCDKKKIDQINNGQSSAEIAQAAVIITGTLDPVTGDFIYDTGEIYEITLPNKVKITEIGKNSTEAKLFNFLNDPNVSVNEDKTQGWITLDRVYFDTGKATLTSKSNKQVKNISEILKAFPSAIVKLGGYTDNTGSDEINKKISAERAKFVEDELIKLGVEPQRISFEGYGAEHPVCKANDTPECRAQNRRVDIRIFEK